jgi:hypothetical protein
VHVVHADHDRPVVGQVVQDLPDATQDRGGYLVGGRRVGRPIPALGVPPTILQPAHGTLGHGGWQIRAAEQLFQHTEGHIALDPGCDGAQREHARAQGTVRESPQQGAFAGANPSADHRPLASDLLRTPEQALESR